MTGSVVYVPYSRCWLARAFRLLYNCRACLVVFVLFHMIERYMALELGAPRNVRARLAVRVHAGRGDTVASRAYLPHARHAWQRWGIGQSAAVIGTSPRD